MICMYCIHVHAAVVTIGYGCVCVCVYTSKVKFNPIASKHNMTAFLSASLFSSLPGQQTIFTIPYNNHALA